MYVMTPDRFLVLLNERAFYENGSVRPRNEPTTDLFEHERKSFKFTKSVDTVVESGCSAHGCEVSFLDNIFLAHPEAKVILVLPDCCGQFASRTQETLRACKPDVTWLFPQIGDYCTNMFGRELPYLVESLLSAEILATENTVTA